MFSYIISENRTVYEIMSKNIGDTEGPQMVTIWRIRVACWISKAIWTYTYAHTRSGIHMYASTRKHAHTQASI